MESAFMFDPALGWDILISISNYYNDLFVVFVIKLQREFMYAIF